MIVNAWRFGVKEGCEDDFVAMSLTDWPCLFSLSDGYLGSCVGRNKDGTYETEDCWSSRKALESFLIEHNSEYTELDRRHKRLYHFAKNVGIFGV